METVSWAKVATVLGVLIALRLIIRGVSSLVSVATSEARDRFNSGQLSRR